MPFRVIGIARSDAAMWDRAVRKAGGRKELAACLCAFLESELEHASRPVRPAVTTRILQLTPEQDAIWRRALDAFPRRLCHVLVDHVRSVECDIEQRNAEQ